MNKMDWVSSEGNSDTQSVGENANNISQHSTNANYYNTNANTNHSISNSGNINVPKKKRRGERMVKIDNKVNKDSLEITRTWE